MNRQGLKPYYPRYWPDWFSYHYACWANNHRGWQKMKKKERRMAKRRLKRELRKEIKSV